MSFIAEPAPDPPASAPHEPAAAERRAHRGTPGQKRLSALVASHSRAIWRALLRLGVPLDALDDATQEVFIVLARRLDGIELGSERAFLYGAALRVAANQRRARRTRREGTLDELPPAALVAGLQPDDLLDQKRMRLLLDRVLEVMPDELREVFVLFELEQLTRTEIALVLGLKAGTVASRLRRAREMFEQVCASASPVRGEGGS
jgi:RNA polymerase sigma-70 factor, ECF subfamily